MANNPQPQQAAPVLVQVAPAKSHTGSAPGLDARDILNFFSLGGASFANLVYTYWFSKYIWQWKATSLPAIGSGPLSDDTRMTWFCWIMLVVFAANVLNALATNYQRTLLAWAHTLSGGVLLAAGVFAFINYYAQHNLTLVNAQWDVMMLTIAMGAICTIIGGIAVKLSKRFLGDVGMGGGNA
jgi:hypothetical protein